MHLILYVSYGVIIFYQAESRLRKIDSIVLLTNFKPDQLKREASVKNYNAVNAYVKKFILFVQLYFLISKKEASARNGNAVNAYAQKIYTVSIDKIFYPKKKKGRP